MDADIVIEKVTTYSPQLAQKVRNLVAQLDDNFQPLYDEDVKEIINSPQTHLYIAQLQHTDTIVGMITLVTYRIPYRKKAWIEDIVIDKPYRNQGFGVKMLQFVIDKAKEMEVTSLNLTSNPFRNTGEFYEQNGFEKRDTVVYRMLLTNT